MPPKRPIEQDGDSSASSGSGVKVEMPAIRNVYRNQSQIKSEITGHQSSGSESPSKKARAQQAFTKEEDEIIINHLLRDKDVRGIKKLLPNRRDSSLRCRVDYLTKKMKTCAGS